MGRAIRAGWMAAVGLGTAAALLVAGCAEGAPALRDAAPAASPSAAPARTSGLPSTAQLQAALLAPTDMGSAFTRQPTESPSAGSGSSGSGSSGTTTVTGCPQLQFLTGVGASTSPTSQGVTYQAGDYGPTVSESLITAPTADLEHTYSDDVSAMKSCKHMEINSNGETFTLTLSPIAFGGPKSAAVRMDGTLQGVQIDAYLAIDRVGPAELAYFFLQVGSGSSQVASFYFRLADAKAQQQLNTFA